MPQAENNSLRWHVEDEHFASRSPQRALAAGAPGAFVLVIADGLAVAFGGESRRRGLTLRIACETAVGTTQVIGQAIMAQRHNRSCLRRGSHHREKCKCGKSDCRGNRNFLNRAHDRGPSVALPNSEMGFDTHKIDYKKIHFGRRRRRGRRSR